MTLIKSNLHGWPNLSDIFEDDWLKSRVPAANWSPAINVISNEGSYEIEVAAPGFKKDEFNVAVEGGVLTISGKTENEEVEKKKNYTRKEFSSRSFSKSFTLPENVEHDAMEAKYEDGVLRLSINKLENNLPSKKMIEVR